MPFFPQFSNLFVPPYIPTVAEKILWLKADTGVTYDGSDLVSLWEDQSGNGHDVTPWDSGYEPLFVDNSLNSLPTIRFRDDGATTSLLVTGNIFPVNYNTPASIIAVLKASFDEVDPDPSQRWLIPAGDSGAFILGMNFGPYNGTRAFSAMIGKNLVGENQILGSELGNPSSAIVSLINNGDTIYFYENGSAVGSISSSSYNTATTSNGVWGIGAQIANGNVYLPATFNLAELIIYNGSISTAERETQEIYLNNKWAIY